MSDLIDRQAALDALGEEPPVWYDGDDEIAERNQWRRDKAAIEAVPPACNENKRQATASSDCIYRKDAIDALKEHRTLYCDNTPDTFSKLSYAEKSRVDELDTAIATLINLPSAESETIHCKDCRNRGEDECPMRHVERIEWEEDGYIESDDIVHDYTEPYGYCDKGERNE